jgi:signal transduction histidine kinase
LLPKIHKLLLALQLIYLFLGFALALSLWIPIPIATLFQILFLISLLTPCIVMGVCLRNVRYKIKSSRYFLLAWGVLCVGAFIATARLLELWPSNWLTLYAFQISSGIEMLLFSFALAYRFQWERQQRELSQEALISSQKEVVGALLLSEERLEKAVDIRTEKLQKLLLSEQAMREQYVRFGAKISHEFRNPLNIIESQTSMLEILPNNSPDLIQKRAKVIHSAVSRLVRLFDQWLESDRLTHENHQINKQTLFLSTWLANLVGDCRDYHPEHTLVVEPSRENISTLGDDHLLQIAVLNLIDNACKFSPPGSSITIGVKIEDYGIGIFVKDQGQGIPQEMLEKVLEPYEQIKEQKQTGGVGLGLAFVKGIMDAHDGRIEIISAPNQGTTIILWIPEETL